MVLGRKKEEEKRAWQSWEHFPACFSFRITKMSSSPVSVQTSHCNAGFTALRPQFTLVHFVSRDQFLADCIIPEIQIWVAVVHKLEWKRHYRTCKCCKGSRKAWKFPKKTASPGSWGKKGGTGSHATCDGAFVQLHSTATQRLRLHD